MLTHLRNAKVTAKDLRHTASLLDTAYDQAAQIRIDGSMSDERINAILDKTWRTSSSPPSPGSALPAPEPQRMGFVASLVAGHQNGAKARG